MRRWSAAAFFVGLALLCGALIEFHRWPTLQVRTHHGDFDELEGYDALWFPDLYGRWQQFDAALGPRDPFSETISMNELVERGLTATVALAGLGLALVLARRRVAGATLLTYATTSGLMLLWLAALDLRGYDRSFGCGPGNPLHSPQLLEFASRFALGTTIVGALAWVSAGRAAGVRFGRAALAGGLAVAMVCVAFVFDRFAFPTAELELTTPVPELWPIWIVAALAACGVWLSLRAQLYVSSAVSLLVLGAGLVALFPVVALERDLRVEIHQSYSHMSRELESIPLQQCEEPALAVHVIVTREGAIVSGRDLIQRDDFDLSIAVAEAIQELEAQFVEVHRFDEGRDPPPFTDRRLTFLVHADAPFENVVAAARGLQSVGISRLQFVSGMRRAEVLWTKSAPHIHQCAVHFELSGDGIAMSDFATWRALVAAIDASPTPLKLTAR